MVSMEVLHQTSPLMQENGSIASDCSRCKPGVSSAKTFTNIAVGCDGLCCGHSHPCCSSMTKAKVSIDSGLGNQLDPISERREFCQPTEEMKNAEEFGHQGNEAPPIRAIERTAMIRGKLPAPACGCSEAGFASQSFSGCFTESEERAIMAKPCQSIAILKSSISSNSRADAPVIASRYELQRATSGGSTYSDEVFRGSVRFNKVRGEGDPIALKERDGQEYEKRQRKIHCRHVKFACFGAVILSIALVAAFLFANFLRRGDIVEMEERIALLERAFRTLRNTPSSLTRTSSLKSGYGWPRMHLILESQIKYPVNHWKTKTLQWSPEIQENGGLQYNNETGTMMVLDPGTYFVYDQVYVFRHLAPSDKGASGLSKHTVFHAIYKRRFNPGANEPPDTLSESALSNCWDSTANTQIHSSYQGILVKLQKNEQLLVALQNYDESVDTLDPASTFFGAFKL